MENCSEAKVRQPGVEPGSIAWKATMLTATPPTLASLQRVTRIIYFSNHHLDSYSKTTKLHIDGDMTPF